jgi:hypothetical protein
MVESLRRSFGLAGAVAVEAVPIPGANLVLVNLEAVGLLAERLLQFGVCEGRGTRPQLLHAVE